jgi:hypothetical protein
MRMLGLIQPSANWLASNTAPATPADFNSFSNFTAFLAQRYRGAVDHWQIWNEPDTAAGWPPAPDPADYALLLAHAYDAIKAVDPSMQVVGISATATNFAFVSNVLARGAADTMDIAALNSDPGSVPAPIEECPDLSGLQAIQALLRTQGCTHPVWITETGYSTATNHALGVTPNLQADLLTRTYLTLLAEGVENIFWYCFGPDRGTGTNLATRFGLLNANGSRKPSFRAFSNMTARLSGRPFMSSLPTGWGSSACLFSNNGQQVTVIWRWGSGDPVRARLCINGTINAAYDRDGSAMPMLYAQQAWLFILSGSPIYLTGHFGGTGSVFQLAWEKDFILFNDMPATAANALPASGGPWRYTTALCNPAAGSPMTENDWAGWRNTHTFSWPVQDYHNYCYLYLNTYNSSHMGFSTYGYLEIDDRCAVAGNSLKYNVTGGINPDGTNGLPCTTKAQYTNYLHLGQDPTAPGVKLGHPLIYFANSSPGYDLHPFPDARGANRMSMYIHPPAELTNGPGGWSRRPVPTINVGPFTGEGGHWYHEICNQGGGWTHVITDGHPQHNNAWYDPSKYPYPSSSLRNMGTGYFTNFYRWYITCKPYDGIATTLYDVWFDEVRFLYDPEPQNNETINNPCITYFPASNTFEVGFMDKYKNCAVSYSTYELRYAFEPINNRTWSNAVPAHILEDLRFGISNRLDGKFHKWWANYASVWAPFTLQSNDTARLTPGTVVHFAIKDISQIDGDSLYPITNTVGRWPVGGRDYAASSNLFDYAGDRPVLKLIKRMDYRIPVDAGDQDADGLPDWWEQHWFGEPTGAQCRADADADGISNADEYAADTQPTNAASILCWYAGMHSNGPIFRWQGGRQARQVIEYAPDLATNGGRWRILSTNQAPTAVSNTWVTPREATKGFFRVRASRP